MKTSAEFTLGQAIAPTKAHPQSRHSNSPITYPTSLPKEISLTQG